MITPALVAAGIAILLTVTQVFLSELYDFNLWLYRRFGWEKMAETWKRRKKPGLMFNRVLLAAMTMGAIVILYKLKT